ncbi:MAG TPA: acetoacetate decarboxylase family protein [Candidatus Binataceae bacterium]|nr:acetoacetate decarboxylase family protein [Candidatus Binataceae bacterium]
MPPRYGKLDLDASIRSAPIIDGFGTAPWTLKGCRWLEFRYEIDDEPADALLPPALHPAMPAYATFTIAHFPQSPVGPFSLGEIRVVGRAGGRPAAFSVGGFCDSAAARSELAAGWGYKLAEAQLRLDARHYEVSAEVTAGTRTILKLVLRDRKSLAATHLQPLPGMNLARNQQNDAAVLVQVDIEAAFVQSDGGTIASLRFDRDAFAIGHSLRLMNPMGSAFAAADVTLGRIQIVCDPAQPAETGTSFIDH